TCASRSPARSTGAPPASVRLRRGSAPDRRLRRESGACLTNGVRLRSRTEASPGKADGGSAVGSFDAGAAVSFGIQLPIQAQSSSFAEGWEAQAGVDELTSIATVAEHAGFDYVAVCDHVAIPKGQAHAFSTTWWDCIATLSYLAGVTSRVRLLSHTYVLPHRHPLVAAKQWMTLDALSGGRAILGVGAGDIEAETTALGVDHAGRGALLDESIDAVRAAFDGEFASHDGQAWSYSEMG